LPNFLLKKEVGLFDLSALQLFNNIEIFFIGKEVNNEIKGSVRSKSKWCP